MLVFAHRGIHDRKITENTLLAFKRAATAEVDGIEFDIHLAADGVPVVVHDKNLRRVAGDARRVRDLTSGELARIVLRGDGSIPTLNDVTAAIHAPMQFDIEIKDRTAIESLIRKLATSAALRERAIISSFYLDALRAVREELPEVRTLSLNRRWPLPLRGESLWRRLKRAGVWGVGFPVNILMASRVQELHRHGWRVASWDLRPSARAARALAQLAPDVAITFRPEFIK